MQDLKPLIHLARETLKFYFQNKQPPIPEQIKTKFSKNQACFVTLTKHGNLRGCIGSLQPRQPLCQDVTENTLNAAFNDYRFPQLTKQELKEIKIEISVLTIPKKLSSTSPEGLLDKINNKMGIILKKGFNSATFLPQVWEQIPDKTTFLEQLSIKAGLDKNAWKNPNTKIEYYKVEKVKED